MSKEQTRNIHFEHDSAEQPGAGTSNQESSFDQDISSCGPDDNPLTSQHSDARSRIKGDSPLNKRSRSSFKKLAKVTRAKKENRKKKDTSHEQPDANRHTLAYQSRPSLLTRALQFLPDKLWQLRQRRKLRKHVQLISGIRNVPFKLDREHPIQLVPITLTKNEPKSVEQLNKEGHYSKPEDFHQLLSLETESLGISEAIEQAFKQAGSDAGQHASEEARQDYIDRNSNNIMFIGQDGIGKTTLTHLIVEMVLEKKLFSKCKYIFFVFCQEINFETKTTLLQMCLNGTEIKFRHKLTTEKALMEAIGDGENVLLVCDGLNLDKANTNAFFTDEPLPLDEIVTADVHLNRLFKAKVWKKSTKVFTCKPGQFHNMTKFIQTASVFTLEGISATSQKNICEQICEMPEQVTLVMAYLQRKRDVAVLCYVPFLCIIIMFVTNKLFAEGKEMEIESLTYIFFKWLEYFCEREHIREKHAHLSKIALLAWNGFKKGLTSTAQNFSHVGMDQSDADVFLIHYADARYKASLKILQDFKQASFTHLLLQKNFSALHLVFYSTLDEFTDILPRLPESQWEVLSRFMFGYFNIELSSTVSSFLTACSCEPNHQICEAKRSKLVEFAVQFMQQISSTDTKNLIIIGGWLNELRDPELNKKIAEYLPSQIKFQGRVLPSDVPSLVYLLSIKTVSLDISRNKEQEFESDSINFGINCFQGKGFSFFMESLRLESTKISTLDLSNNNIGDKGTSIVAEVLPNIGSLKLSSCGITAKGAKSIAERLSNTKFSTLNLTGNIIGKSGIDALSKCNINELVLTSYAIHEGKIFKHGDVWIGNNETHLMEKLVVNKIKSRTFNINKFVVLEPKLPTSDVAACLSLCLQHFDQVDLRRFKNTSDDLQELAYAISLLHKPLKSLDLNNNRVDDESARAISAAIHNIKELGLWNCKLSKAAMQTLAKSIKELKNPMELLDLTYNEVDDESARAISAAIHNIKRLTLYDCKLSNAAKQTLAKSIKELKEPIKSLDLGYNKVNDESARAISAAIHNIEELKLFKCEFSNTAMQTLIKLITELKQPMKSLDLGYNKVDDESARAISAAIHNIKKLELDGCELSNAALQTLAKSIKELKQPIKSLDLKNNKVDDESARAISDAIRNIEKLRLYNCKLSNAAMQTLAKAIKELNQPIASLDLSRNKVDDESARVISAAVHNIAELELYDCKLLKAAMQTLAESIKEQPVKQPMKLLNLRWNEVDETIATSLAHCLHNIELLWIGGWWRNISDKVKNILKSKQQELNLPEERVQFFR